MYFRKQIFFMKRIVFLAIQLIAITVWSQTNTEVFLFDLQKEGNSFVLNNQRNVSNNEGYDNQPSFFDENTLLFAGTRNGQTDIAAYTIKTNTIRWVNSTPEGSEYSPTKIPDANKISSIRLDKDGKQLLYAYDYKTGKSKALFEDLKIGYHTWYDENIVVSSVLEDGGLSLVVSNLKDNTNKTIQKKTGRSLHKIPNSNLISYISKENENWEIKSLDPLTGVTKKITNTFPNVEDMCWLADGTIIMGKGNSIFKFKPKEDQFWNIFHSFTDKEIGNITRITTNATSTMLALVSDASPEHIVQKQLDAYNKRDIEEFLAAYSKNVKVYDFPEQLQYEGLDKMRTSYAGFFKNTPNLHCEIKNRIVFGNKVIDEELVTVNGSQFSVIAIYEVSNGKISKVTFIR
ncbi:hypothetical protein SAMN04488508_10266 [Aquimarina spongiae]|uniref:SnoaL-like domain-containing protein n=2 Tax=Aquimarina spongiae TaxID=570521 RepID=A0A1M6CDG8_9FLAO|nr:hypothetical protein SAMN04488508_10266 [Aquimarina spongiae]